MSLSDEIIEKIERYVNNEMSVDERQTFEAEMEKDLEFKKEVEAYIKIFNGFEELNFRKRLKLIGENYKQGGGMIAMDRRPYISYAMAASVAIILFAGLYFFTNLFKPETEIVFNDYYRPETLARGECPQDLAAFPLYNDKKYEEALKAVNSLKPDSILCVTYFKGLVELALNKKEAVDDLKLAATSINNNIRDKAEWYLALALLKQGNKEEAIKMLQKITIDPEHPFYEMAGKALKALQ